MDPFIILFKLHLKHYVCNLKSLFVTQALQENHPSLFQVDIASNVCYFLLKSLIVTPKFPEVIFFIFLFFSY